MKKIISYKELSRPFTLLSPAVGFIGGGLMAWGDCGAKGLPPAAIWIGAVGAMLLNAYSNSLNQIFDLEIDRINQPARPLPSGRLSLGEVWIFTAACLAGALALGSLAGSDVAIFFIAAAITTTAYSVPPVRTKARGALANVTIAFARGMLLFVSGWSAVTAPSGADPWAAAIILALFVSGAASTKDFSDTEGDRACGIVTLPVKYGAPTAAKIIAPFLFVPFLLAPAFVAARMLRPEAAPLAALSLYGLAAAIMLIHEQSGGGKEKSRASWAHMYILLILAQAGFAVCYIIAARKS